MKKEKTVVLLALASLMAPSASQAVEVLCPQPMDLKVNDQCQYNGTTKGARQILLQGEPNDPDSCPQLAVGNPKVLVGVLACIYDFTNERGGFQVTLAPTNPNDVNGCISAHDQRGFDCP